MSIAIEMMRSVEFPLEWNGHWVPPRNGKSENEPVWAVVQPKPA